MKIADDVGLSCFVCAMWKMLLGTVLKSPLLTMFISWLKTFLYNFSNSLAAEVMTLCCCRIRMCVLVIILFIYVCRELM